MVRKPPFKVRLYSSQFILRGLKNQHKNTAAMECRFFFLELCPFGINIVGARDELIFHRIGEDQDKNQIRWFATAEDSFMFDTALPRNKQSDSCKEN